MKGTSGRELFKGNVPVGRFPIDKEVNYGDKKRRIRKNGAG
jgi:hypothetical protein